MENLAWRWGGGTSGPGFRSCVPGCGTAMFSSASTEEAVSGPTHEQYVRLQNATMLSGY
ncbi:MAG: hypothetical protein ACTSSA_03255 [Candidatus Freyarchaeota archaeon]